MTKGEAFLTHCVNKNLSVTLKKWLTLAVDRKNEFNQDLHFANVPGEVTADVFGEGLKPGNPVHKFRIKGVTAYCLVGNFNKLTTDQKLQFDSSLSVFSPGK